MFILWYRNVWYICIIVFCCFRDFQCEKTQEKTLATHICSVYIISINLREPETNERNQAYEELTEMVHTCS